MNKLESVGLCAEGYSIPAAEKKKIHREGSSGGVLYATYIGAAPRCGIRGGDSINRHIRYLPIRCTFERESV